MQIVKVSFDFNVRFQGKGVCVPDIVIQKAAEQILRALKLELNHLEGLRLDNDNLLKITTGSPEATGA